MSILPEIPADKMTSRARQYLIATALYCWAIAIFCMFIPQGFSGKSFDVIKTTMFYSLDGWGFCHFVVGLIAASAAWRGSERLAYSALISTAGVVGAWAAGFYLSYLTVPGAAPTGCAAYTLITVYNLIQARNPLRSPFEPVIRSFVRRDASKRE